MDEQILKQIADTFKKAIQTELLVPRVAKTYSGVQKPISGKFRYGATPPKASGALYNSVNVYWEADLEDAQPNLVLDFGNNENLLNEKLDKNNQLEILMKEIGIV